MCTIISIYSYCLYYSLQCFTSSLVRSRHARISFMFWSKLWELNHSSFNLSITSYSILFPTILSKSVTVSSSHLLSATEPSWLVSMVWWIFVCFVSSVELFFRRCKMALYRNFSLQWFGALWAPSVSLYEYSEGIIQNLWH